jgi:hypothetical protein
MEMKYSPWLLIVCGVGSVLLIAGLMLGGQTGVVARSSWTEEDAKKFNQVSATFHQVAHAHGDAKLEHNHGHSHGPDGKPPPSDADFEKAKADWQEQMKLRDSAIAWRDRVKAILKYAGIVLISIGGVGFLIVKNVVEDQD